MFNFLLMLSDLKRYKPFLLCVLAVVMMMGVCNLLTSCGRGHAQDFSAGGIALGMTQDEVKKVIDTSFETHIANVSLSSFISIAPPGGVTLPILFAENKDKSKRYTVVYYNDKVVIVGFRRIYPHDVAPTVENFQSSLSEKYGPATNSNGSYFHWAFDKDDGLITDERNWCAADVYSDRNKGGDPGDPNSGTSSFGVLLGCAKIIHAWLVSPWDGGGTTIWVTNSQLFTDAHDQIKKAQTDAEATKLQVQQRVKPDL